MKRILVLAALVGLVVATAADARTDGARIPFVQQTTSDGDSLSATADTSLALTIPVSAIEFAVVVRADSVATIVTQVSEDNGTSWRNIDAGGSTVALPYDISPTFTGGMKSWSIRVIIDGAWSTGKKLGKAYLMYKRD